MGRRGTIEPLASRKRDRPVTMSGPMQTPSSALGSALAAVWLVRESDCRLSVCCVTIQQVPNGKGGRVGLVPCTSSSGVDGELRMLIRLLRVAAMALWRCSVYFRGRW